jgi:hypothetical protein
MSLDFLTRRAKRSPSIQLAAQKGCLDTNYCVMLRIFGKDFYPSVFGNGNFAICEDLTAVTAAGVRIRISVNQETPPFVDVTGKTVYDLQVCTGPTAKYICFKNLDMFAELDYGDATHQFSNFVKFTIESQKHTFGEAAKALAVLLSGVAKHVMKSPEA